MTSYLGLGHEMATGQRLVASDLELISMRAGAGVSAIPLSQAGRFLGHRVNTDLPAGTVLVPADFLARGVPSSNRALVGASLQPGQAPASLAAGDSIWAITSSSSTTASGAASSEQLLARGTVFSVVPGSSAGGNLEVSIEVPRRRAPAVAAASAAGALSLVEVAPGSPARSGLG